MNVVKSLLSGIAVCCLSAGSLLAVERVLVSSPQNLGESAQSGVQEVVGNSQVQKDRHGTGAGIAGVPGSSGGPANSGSPGSGALPTGGGAGQMGMSKQEQQSYSGFYQGQGSGGMSPTATIIHENSKRKEEGRPAMSAYEECITRAGGDPAAAVNCAPHGNNPGSGAGYGEEDTSADSDDTSGQDEESSGSWFSVDMDDDSDDDSGDDSGSGDDSDQDEQEDDSSDDEEKNSCEPEDGDGEDGEGQNSGNPMDGDTGMNVPLSPEAEAVVEKLTGGKTGTGLAVQQGTAGGADDPRTGSDDRGDTSGGISYTPGTAGSPDDGRGIDDPIYNGPSGNLKMTKKEQLGGTIDRTGR
ncbi:MAG: hypothetical protein UMU76_08215 [Prosthecochloris sp.]|nr:hypothetical protein [Prosthecochloris sp.]